MKKGIEEKYQFVDHLFISNSWGNNSVSQTPFPVVCLPRRSREIEKRDISYFHPIKTYREKNQRSPGNEVVGNEATNVTSKITVFASEPK